MIQGMEHFSILWFTIICTHMCALSQMYTYVTIWFEIKGFHYLIANVRYLTINIFRDYYIFLNRVPYCRTVTDFEKSPYFYVSSRNTRQRDPITTRPTSTCCGSLSRVILLLTQKRGDFSKSVTVWQLGIYPKNL